MKLVTILLAAFIGILFFSFIGLILLNQKPMLDDVHHHADFKLIINNEIFDFNQSQYMSDKENPKTPFMHLHDNDGDIIHQHISDGSLGYFFSSLGMEFTANCFTLDNKTTYCTDDTSTLQMFVNGKENTKMERYIFQDLDQILITYGKDQTLINKQLRLVSDKSCIQSGLCPDRGLPGNESGCTTQGGCKA